MTRGGIRWLASSCLERVAPEAFPAEDVADVIEEDPVEVQAAMDELVEQGRVVRIGDRYASKEVA